MTGAGKMGKWRCTILLMGLHGACASTPEIESPVVQGPPKVVTENVILGVPQQLPRPLPVQYPVTLEQTMTNGSVKVDRGFRGWDVNRDGRLDILDVLDEHGQTLTSAFDFDFDGKVDMVRSRQETPK